MILCDAGPLVALHDAGDSSYERCSAALAWMDDEKFITTWPCLSESMYLLGRAVGYLAQEELWKWIDDEVVLIHEIQSGERERMRELMHKYRDLPMDFADASLVAAAERLNIKRIFTIDSHFRIYKFKGKHSFEVIP